MGEKKKEKKTLGSRARAHRDGEYQSREELGEGGDVKAGWKLQTFCQLLLWR